MIARVWHGWTTPENADLYERLLKEHIFPSILARRIEGYRGIQLLRRPAGPEVEFQTIMWSQSSRRKTRDVSDLRVLRAPCGECFLRIG